MKVSFLTSALFYFFLFFFKEQSVGYIVPLGILGGFSGGNYWASYNLNQYILTQRHRRVEYLGWGLALVNLASAIGPVFGGWLISFVAQFSLAITSGYAALFFLVFSIMAAAVVVIGKLPSHEAPQFSYRHIFDHRRSTHWRLVLTQQGLLGFFDVALTTVMGILLYLAVEGEAALGFFLTLAAILGIGASIVSIKILKKFSGGFWIGAIGWSISMILFAVLQNKLGVWMYVVVSGLTVAFFQNALSLEFFRALDTTTGGWEQKYHMLLEQALIMGVLRIVGLVILFVLLQLGDEVLVARTWLMVLPILPLSIGYFLRKSLLLLRS